MTSRQILQISGPPGVSSTYQYYADGQLKFSHSLDDRFDRAFSYDNVGRTVEAYSGSEARDFNNNTYSGPATGPYRQSYTYNAWNDMSRSGKHWQAIISDTPTYSNKRRSDWYYDAEGNVTWQPYWKTHTYDASGREIEFYEKENGTQTHYNTIQQVYDGDGQIGKRVETRVTDTEEGQTTHVTTTYYLRSSVLGGQIITEFDQYGYRRVGHVYAGGTRIADQNGWSAITWRNTNPVTGAWLSTNSARVATRTETDPLGADVGLSNPYSPFHTMTYSEMIGGDALYFERANPFDYGGGCILDGMPIPCSQLQSRMDAGTVQSQSRENPINARNGTRRPDVRPIVSHGIGLFGVDIPRDNDMQWERHLVAFNHAAPQKTRPCTFNVNIVGMRLSQVQKTLIQREMNRLFSSTGHRITIDTPNGADASYNLSLTQNTRSLPPDERANPRIVGNTPLRAARPSDPGYQDAQLFDGKVPGEHGFVYMNRPLFANVKDINRRLW